MIADGGLASEYNLGVMSGVLGADGARETLVEAREPAKVEEVERGPRRMREG